MDRSDMLARACGRRTIAEALEGAGREANSFDAIRLFAATTVLISHAFVLTSGVEAREPLFALTGGLVSMGSIAVGLFFSISGFLIDRSLERSRSTWSFVRKRCLRILPGLWASLAVTTLAAATFFAADGWGLFARASTWAFLGNGFFLPVSTLLPGVFGDRPLPSAFNGSLWTLKYEVACYALTIAVAWFGRMRGPVLVGLWLLSLIYGALTEPAGASGAVYYLRLLADLFQYFGFGMILNAYKTRIPHSVPFALALVALWFVLLWTPAAQIASPLLLTYPAIALGAAPSALARAIARRGDISYGVYVNAFPIQQALIPLALATPAPWATNILLALPATFALAILSWRFVEKPSIDLGAARAPRDPAA